MKYLGIDYGTRRVGVAISDEEGKFAFPRHIFDTRVAAQEIALLVKKEAIDQMIIGQSTATNGRKNEIAGRVSEFAQKLNERAGLPVHFEREDFSSVEAHRYQTNAKHLDDSAAAIILQRFLDKQRKEH